MDSLPQRKAGTAMRNCCAGALHTPDGKVPPGGVFFCTAAKAREYLAGGLAEKVRITKDGRTEAMV